MKRTVWMVVVVCIGLAGIWTCASAATPALGVAAIGFFPKGAGLDAFLSENGLPSMGTGLVGGSGSVRLPGPSGIESRAVAWGVGASLSSATSAADLVSAVGGLELAQTIGGDDTSTLKVGGILGGGATVLSIRGYLHPTLGDGGFAPEPARRDIVRAVVLVMPGIQMAVEIAQGIEIELRMGYLQPLFGVTFGDVFGIPAPSLDLSGSIVSLGLSLDLPL